MISCLGLYSVPLPIRIKIFWVFMGQFLRYHRSIGMLHNEKVHQLVEDPELGNQTKSGLITAVIERHAAVRIGLASCLGERYGSIPVFFFDSLEDLIHQTSGVPQSIGLIILGQTSEDLVEVREAAAWIAGGRGDHVPILVFSELEERVYASLSIAAGASGFVHKSAAVSVLLEAVNTLLDEGGFINGKPFRIDRNGHASPTVKDMPFANLSEREFQMAWYFAQGYRMADIAEELGLGRSTVSTYKKRLFEKLNIKSSSQFVQFWNYFCRHPMNAAGGLFTLRRYA